MRIEVQLLGMPSLTQVLGSKKVTVDLPGRTVADLVAHLVQRFGRPAREALLDSSGQLDHVVQVLVNERSWVTRDDHDRELEEGDVVALLMLVAGG